MPRPSVARAVLPFAAMTQELIVAVRAFLKRPGYALAVTLTLALGIGATTVMFSLLDAALLRPLPFAGAGRLAVLTGVAGPERAPRGASFPEAADWEAMNTTFGSLAIYDETSLNLRLGTEAVRVDAEMVSASFFSILGAQAALGRTFQPEEDTVPDRAAVVVISHALWRDRFGASPAVLQQQIHLNDRAFTIVGVMPERFAGLSFDTDLWFPAKMVSLTSSPGAVQNRGTRWVTVVGRLAEGVTLERAQDDMDRVAALLEQRYPDNHRERGVQVDGLQRSLVGDTRGMVLMLFGAVVLFLLVACANVASLQLARATARRRELAVRLALGARKYHLVRQLLAESFVLSTAAGILGLLGAVWALTALVSMLPEGALPRHVTPVLDLRASAFAFVVSLMSGGLVAVLPALAATRRDLSGAMKEGARSAGPGLGSIRQLSAQHVLVVGEVALAVTLLASAGLLVRSLDRQINVRLGFDPADVTAARVTLPAARYAPEVRAQFVDRLAAQLRQLPGVETAALATSLPFTGTSSAAILAPEGAERPEDRRRYYRNYVSPDTFPALGITLTRGRPFTAADVAGAPPVAIINESGARQLWADGQALGRRVRIGGGPEGLVEIVGVAADARFRSLTTDFAAPRVEPDLYFPLAQRTDRDLQIAVKAAPGQVVTLASLQQALSSVDATLPLYDIQRLDDALAQQTATQRFGSALLAVFSLGALLLAGIGLYGLIAYIVGLSRREIAIRLALGARGRQVMMLVATNGLALVAGGIVIGVAGAVTAGRVLESQLFQTGTIDPPTLAGVAAVTIVVALAAMLQPTRSALRTDPQSALRGD
jgi:predicted permease